MLFVIFDLEAVFIFAYARGLRGSGAGAGYAGLLVFVGGAGGGADLRVPHGRVGLGARPAQDGQSRSGEKGRGVPCNGPLSRPQPAEAEKGGFDEAIRRLLVMARMEDLVDLGPARTPIWPFHFGVVLLLRRDGHQPHQQVRRGPLRRGGHPRHAAGSRRPSSSRAPASSRWRPSSRRLYEQMMEPRWVISMGSCANSGGHVRHLQRGSGSGQDPSRGRLRAGVPAESLRLSGSLDVVCRRPWATSAGR